MAVYQAPNSANLVSLLARDYAVQVNTGDETTPEWVFVRGLSTVTPSAEPVTQDDGDIDAQGYGSQLATGLNFSMTLEGNRKGTGDAESFTADPGQEFLRLKGAEVGYKNIAQVRYWRTDSDPEAREFSASVSYTNSGGDKESLASWSCTLNGRGRPTDIEKPAGEAEDSTPSIPVGEDGNGDGGDSGN